MIQITEYKIKKDHDGERVIYYIFESRNPHVAQHPGFFSTRALARKALQRKAWGETVSGDC